jgi:hypothetical protein
MPIFAPLAFQSCIVQVNAEKFDLFEQYNPDRYNVPHKLAPALPS